jgi:proline iminopeptidase
MKKALITTVRIALCLGIAFAILFILFFLLTIGEYSVPRTVAEDPSLPSVTINSSVFHAEAFGDPAKPVVIIVHR